MVISAQTMISTMLPVAPRPEAGMPLMPISPPSQLCLRTKPVNRKFTPIVVTARKSLRTRSDAKPTTMPSRLPTTAPATSASTRLWVATAVSAAA